MTDQVWPVQRAIYSRLATANPLICEGRVFDAPEDGTQKPYVEIGDVNPIADDATGSDGFETVVTLHVWSDYRGNKEAIDIIGQIRSALHQKTLDETGLSSCSCYLRGSQVFDDPNGITRHGVVTLLIRHHQTTL